jgi:hypothetical protein
LREVFAFVVARRALPERLTLRDFVTALLLRVVFRVGFVFVERTALAICFLHFSLLSQQVDPSARTNRNDLLHQCFGGAG